MDTTTTTVPTSTTIDPATTQEGVLLAKYMTARNAGDVAEAMKAFAGDPVVKRHPFALNDYMNRTSEVRDIEEGVAAIQGSGTGFEFVDIEVADGSSVVAPDVTFNWRFLYGADGSESGGEAGCIGVETQRRSSPTGRSRRSTGGSRTPLNVKPASRVRGYQPQVVAVTYLKLLVPSRTPPSAVRKGSMAANTACLSFSWPTASRAACTGPPEIKPCQKTSVLV